MNNLQIINEMFEGKIIELESPIFEKSFNKEKPIMLVIDKFNEKYKYVINDSIKNFKRFSKWDGLKGKNTSIQPLIGRYLKIENRLVQLCRIKTDVYETVDVIDKFPQSKDKEGEENNEYKK